MIALALLLAAAPAPASSTADAPLARAPALFQRAEPHLAAGARALAGGDVDGAIERYRRAAPESDDERAIVEYDVGAALLMRAQLAAAPPTAAGGGGSMHADPSAGAGAVDGAPPAGPDQAALDDAVASFERAYGIAKDRRLKSEAALASGNAAAMGGKLDDAIAQFRKALVADPANARAKVNLKRALEAKRAQPPPPPNPEGGEGDEKEPKDGEQKEEPKDGEKKEEPKDGEQKDGEQKDGEQKDGEQKEQEPKDGEKKPEEKPADAQAQKKKLKKEEARRMLEMMRARERPLTPMEMRGQQKVQKPKNGKDW